MCSRIAFAALAALLSFAPALPTQAALNDSPLSLLPTTLAPADFVDAHQYKINNALVPGAPGAPSTRQSVTAWQVARGSWEGQNLDGLSLVLVTTRSNEARPAGTTHCYVSHLATPAQRSALLNAFAASLPEGDTLRARPTNTWRIEPAVIKLEYAGQTIILHLGAIA